MQNGICCRYVHALKAKAKLVGSPALIEIALLQMGITLLVSGFTCVYVFLYWIQYVARERERERERGRERERITSEQRSDHGVANRHKQSRKEPRIVSEDCAGKILE